MIFEISGVTIIASRYNKGKFKGSINKEQETSNVQHEWTKITETG